MACLRCVGGVDAFTASETALRARRRREVGSRTGRTAVGAERRRHDGLTKGGQPALQAVKYHLPFDASSMRAWEAANRHAVSAAWFEQ